MPDGDVLGVDVLARILRHVHLHQLLTSKRVCKAWAAAARRTLHDEAWRDANWRAPAGYSRVESAQRAFEALGAGERVDKRLVAKKCGRIWKILNVPERRQGSVDWLLTCLFRDAATYTCRAPLFTKSVHVAQQRGSDKICIYSDVYDVRPAELDEFARTCTASGLETHVFEIDYPGLPFNHGYVPPGLSDFNTGYAQLYRGKLSGVVL